MKKFFIAFLFSITFFTNTTCFDESTIVHSTKFEHYDVIKETVYRTETGKRYHLNSCRYLKYSKFPIRKSGCTSCRFYSLQSMQTISHNH